ncbi:MAG: DUF1501 domain-containing protein [Pirellulales bacterium]|nr:DUF1501 domain-containing protein [Pirellulales bacterium]
MFRILGSTRTLCEGLTRRDLLRAGGLGLAGLALPDVLRLQAAAATSNEPRPATFGRAKAVILIHLYGSPSQLEWADMKPHAPVEIRGEFGGIPSSLPGCDVCELLPKLARVMDRTTVIRSMTHPYPIHGVAFALTGIPTMEVAMELAPNDTRHWPFFGSVVDYVEQRNDTTSGVGRPRAVPRNIALPFPMSTRRIGEVPRAGPYAAFLGKQYNPVWTDYVGAATRGLPMVLNQLRFNDNDPYMGLAPDSYFYVPSATALADDVTLDRLDRRRSLLEQLDHTRPRVEATAASTQLDRYQQMAFAMLQSPQLRDALDLRREAPDVRELYGHTLFGQACLAARRLVEAGSRVVTVFWDEFGLAGHAWDTHYNHFERMRKALCPGFDHGFSGLLLDLETRGLLDDVAVVCTSEHGRTPQINGQAGRDHWSSVYTSMIAGAGVKRGFVLGASDKRGAEVVDRPVSPKQLLATMYHLLGIDHRQIVHDTLGRPLPLVDAEVIDEVLA